MSWAQIEFHTNFMIEREKNPASKNCMRISSSSSSSYFSCQFISNQLKRDWNKEHYVNHTQRRLLYEWMGFFFKVLTSVGWRIHILWARAVWIILKLFIIWDANKRRSEWESETSDCIKCQK